MIRQESLNRLIECGYIDALIQKAEAQMRTNLRRFLYGEQT